MNAFRQIGSPGKPRGERWTRHDGTGIPVPPATAPGVEFRNGWRVPPDTYLAADWARTGNGGFWRHSGGPLDIVSFLPVADPRAAIRVVAAVRATLLAHHRRGTTDWINDALAKDIIELVASTLRNRSGV